MNPGKVQIYIMPSLYTHINKTVEITILDIILRTNKIFLPKQVYFLTVSLYRHVIVRDIQQEKISILKCF